MGRGFGSAFGRLLDAEQRAYMDRFRPDPYLYRGRLVRKPRINVTIRKARPPDQLPLLVRQVIAKWVQGQSYRWLARMFVIDRDTVRRWVQKHPHEVQRAYDELSYYGAYTTDGLRRKYYALLAMGVRVRPP